MAASFDSFFGKRGSFRTSRTGALHELVGINTAAAAITATESAPGGNQNLRYDPTNKGTQPVRPYQRSSFIGAVTARDRAITAGARHQEIQHV